MSNPIILEIAGKEIHFEPNMTAYNGFINEMAMDNKVALAHNYLSRIVVKEHKADLDELLNILARHCRLQHLSMISTRRSWISS